MGNKHSEPPPAKELYNQNDRGCTDLIFLLLFIVFWVGMVAVSAVAFRSGDVRRLIRATDFEGNHCGIDGERNQPNSKDLQDAGISQEWKELKNIWYPLLPKNAIGDLPKLLKMGICVKECPSPNTDLFTVLNFTTIKAYHSLQSFPVLYKSKPTLYRCTPLLDDSTTLSLVKSVLQEFNSLVEVSKFAQRAIDELANCAPALLVCGGICFVSSLIYVYLLRVLTAPMVWITILVVPALLIGCGILSWTHAKDLENNGYSGDKDYVKLWKAVAIIAWVVTGIYLLLLVWLMRRIRIAIEIIEMSATVLSSVRTLLLVPIIIYFLIMILAIYCILVGIWLKTSATLKSDQIVALVPTALLPNMTSNITTTTELPSSITYYSTKAVNLTTTFLETDKAAEVLMIYDLFGFLWTMGLLKSVCFMVIAFVAVFWYFSIPGDNKSIPLGSVPRAVYLTLRYHIGTLAFGSFIIAVIQLIRFLLSRVQKKLEKEKGNPVVAVARVLLCCIQCFLACWERCIRFINKNAYIVCCIKGTNFCRSSMTALDLILSNLGEMAATNFIADTIFGFSKFLLTLVNMFICYLLVSRTKLAEGSNTIVLPILIVGFIAYIVASLFMHIFDAVQDTILLCFCYDRSENNGNDKPYYMTTDLSNIIEKYNRDTKSYHPPQVANEALPAKPS